jgi:hypothetical protein
VSFNSGTNRVLLHIPHCVPAVAFIEYCCVELSLPKMTGFGVPQIEILRIVAIDPLKCATQRMLKPGNGDEMNMIGHHAVSPNPNRMFDALPG